MSSLHQPQTWMVKFTVAFAGLFYAFRTQSSMRVHGMCAGLVVGLASLTGLAPLEWAVLLLAMGLVVGMELVNTSLEAIVDRVSPEHSEMARVAKDTAAAAVLVSALTALGVGGCVLIPHWRTWLGF